MVQRTYIFNILGKDKNNSLQARIDVYYLIYVLSRYRRPQKKKICRRFRIITPFTY